jgi:hypothetical protein
MRQVKGPQKNHPVAHLIITRLSGEQTTENRISCPTNVSVVDTMIHPTQAM